MVPSPTLLSRESSVQKQPSRGVLREMCSENIHWKHTTNLHENAHAEVWFQYSSQLYWNCTSAWVFSCKFTTYFQNTFFAEHLWTAASVRFYYEHRVLENNSFCITIFFLSIQLLSELSYPFHLTNSLSPFLLITSSILNFVRFFFCNSFL